MEEEYLKMDENSSEARPRWIYQRPRLTAGLTALAIAILVFSYGYHQRLEIRHLSAQESVANATINDLQRQLSSVTEKLTSMIAEQQTATAAGKRARKQTTKVPTFDQRYEQLQAELTEQQRQLRETQDLIARNRAELEGSLDSTRDQLNGSIAKTHEELVALAKRGERTYFEFDLAKSKQFQRIGPLPLSLRKTDTKHNSFDMAMIVDDNQLMKKKVNLYEPIWIHTENQSQPLQVVVNRISKDLVHGYVGAPRYKPSELAAGSPGAVNPVVSPRITAAESTKP
jgi:hypothetical protein